MFICNAPMMYINSGAYDILCKILDCLWKGGDLPLPAINMMISEYVGLCTSWSESGEFKNLTQIEVP